MSSDVVLSSSEVRRKAGSGGGWNDRNFGGCGVYVGALVVGRVEPSGVPSVDSIVVWYWGICETNHWVPSIGSLRIPKMLDK